MTDKEIWLQKFKAKAATVHKRNLDRFSTRMYNRCTQWRSSLTTRSKKYGVDNSITLDELRELLYADYGKQCKYCGKRLDMNTLVLDHIIPISKGGSSNIDNLQIICRTSNGMKGSLYEIDFYILLNWLDTIPDELKRDISVRLARGVI